MGVQYEKQWQFDTNRQYTPPDAVTLTKYQLWYLVSVLTGVIGGFTLGLATVVGSSDGVTASPNDGVNRWGNTFDPSKIIQAAAGVAHSWVLLRFAPTVNGKQMYLLLDAAPTSTTDNFTYSIANAAPTGGGTITAVPTFAVGTVTTSGSTSRTVNDAGTGARRFNAGLTQDGEFFYVLMAKEGSNASQWLFFGGVTTDYRAADTSPFIVVNSYAATQHPGDLAAATSTMLAGISPTGGANLCFLTGRASSVPYLGTTGVDAITGKYLDLPVYVIGAGPTWKGRIPDFGCHAGSNPTGVNVDDVASPKSVLLHRLWIPYPTLPVM